MSEYFTSGSAIERALICAPSVVLPHAHFESEHTARGSAIHAFLEACTTVGRDAALEQVPHEWREACAELNIDGLHAQLALAAEVAFAYNVATDTARELGRGAGRCYDDVGEDEIPCTLDVVGVRPVPDGTRGLYVEWKSGFTTRRPIDAVLQIDFGALVIARCYGCDVVEGQLVHVHEDLQPWVQRTTFEGWELDAFAAELREYHARWKKMRAEWRAGVLPTEYRLGPWCDRCPARGFCDAQTRHVRSLITRDAFDGVMRMEPIPDSAFAQLWSDLALAQSQISFLKSKMLGIASSRPIFLGMSDDGRERWLRSVVSDGVEKLDGESVYDVVAELYGETAAAAATRVTATKEDLGDALKAAVPRGKKAEAVRTVLERLREMPGGTTRKITVSVKEQLLKPAGHAPPALDSGAERPIEELREAASEPEERES